MTSWHQQTLAQDCNPIEMAELLAQDRGPGDQFGISVCIDGDTAIIGAHKDNDNGADSGSAYIFVMSKGKWTQQAKLLPDDGATGDSFGWSVDIDGDYAIVGAPNDGDTGMNTGSAYIFKRSGTNWSQQAKLLPADLSDNDRYGISVSIDGVSAAVGAFKQDSNGTKETGAAYVYRRITTIWIQVNKFVPLNGIFGGRYGFSVSIDAGTLVVSASRDDDNGQSAGAAYVYATNGLLWNFQEKLLPQDGVPFASFGDSVAVSADTIICSAHIDPENGSFSGAAYIFTKENDQWSQQAKIFPADIEPGDTFSSAVAIHGDTAIIASGRDEDNGPQSGSAYVFNRTNGVWTEGAKILPTGGEQADFFGQSVSVSSGIAIVGEYLDNNSGFFNVGSAFIYELNCSVQCQADLNGDGFLNFFDVSDFLTAFGSQDPSADFSEDGNFNFLDVSAFLTAFAAGCP